MEAKDLKFSEEQIFTRLIAKRRATPHFDGSSVDEAALKTNRQSAL
jgi:hypothetical protein